MDIDFLIPRTESCDSANETLDDFCCDTSRDDHGRKQRAKQSDSCSTSERADLLESVTNKCQELTQQLQCATEELELNDRKLENYCQQVRIWAVHWADRFWRLIQITMYEEEIQRLNRELSGGRSIEALAAENNQRSRDRVYDQLNMQLDLLQQRNEELEKEVIQCNALNIQVGIQLDCFPVQCLCCVTLFFEDQLLNYHRYQWPFSNEQLIVDWCEVGLPS